MAKQKEFEQIATIIPENEYDPELEKDVEYYYSIAEKPLVVYNKRYTASGIPTFKDKKEENEYFLQEIDRLINGYDGLCGKGYGWVNHVKIRDPERGIIRPDFRAKQEEYFKKVEELQLHKGKGLVGFKRRRWGFSWAGAWDDEHDAMTKPFYQIGMNSKSDMDSRLLFRNVKFIHQNLPEQLRPRATASDRRDFMHFAWYDKDAQGNKITKGIQSWISSVAPTDNAHEGQAYSKLRIDEAGKIPNLLTIWGYAEDCLRLNTRRVGLPIILGTVGDIDKDGKGLMELYMNNTAYDLERFAVYGYHGLIMDQFGNDMVKDAIRFIVYERKKLESATRKIREAYVQKYPLCEKDAFNHITDGGVGNMQLINTQIVKLMGGGFEKRMGFMRRKEDGGVDFVPDHNNGKVIVYSMPDYNRLHGYVAGADPADHDDAKHTKDTSELALAIVAKPFGTEPPKLVLEYCDRPDKLDKFFEQSAMALQWFNHTKVLIEDNRARMVNYFKEHYSELLPLVPKSIGMAKLGFEMKHSVRMTEERKQQMMGLLEDHIDKFSEFIPSIKLLEQHKVFGDEHATDDLAIAWGWALVLLQSERRPAVLLGADDPNKPNFHYQRMGNVIKMVSAAPQMPICKVRLPSHPLFKAH